MKLVSSPSVLVAREFVNELTHNYAKGRVIVAVDGITNTSGIADTIAEAFGEAGRTAVRASITGFSRPRAEWFDQARPGRAWYEKGFDYETFRRVLVSPFRLAGSAGFQTAVFDPAADAPLVSSWLTTQQDAALVVDGPFLLRKEIRGIWNLAMHLSVGEDALEGLDPLVRVANDTYLFEANPGQVAQFNVDNSDPSAPLRTFADSC